MLVLSFNCQGGRQQTHLSTLRFAKLALLSPPPPVAAWGLGTFGLRALVFELSLIINLRQISHPYYWLFFTFTLIPILNSTNTGVSRHHLLTVIYLRWGLGPGYLTHTHLLPSLLFLPPLRCPQPTERPPPAQCHSPSFGAS